MERRREQVDATRRRILAAAIEEWLEVPYDQMTLDAIAERAGVTRQTVIRHFGCKDALALDAARWFSASGIVELSAGTAGDPGAALDALVERYEVMGDANVRFAALEGRIEAADEAVRIGRANHRAWIEEVFADSLAGLADAERERLVDAVYAATDVFVWKLLRRDFGRTQYATRIAIGDLVAGATGDERCLHTRLDPAPGRLS